MPELQNKLLPSVSNQVPNVLDQSDVMPFMPNADFFLWFTPIASRIAILLFVFPFFIGMLRTLGVFDRIIFPLAGAYISSLKPFLQLTVSAELAPMMSGITNLLYVIFVVLGVAVTTVTIRLLRNSNSLCLTVKGISLGTASGTANRAHLESNSTGSNSPSGGSPNFAATSGRNEAQVGAVSVIAKNQVIYQERHELDFKQVSSIEIIRPKTTRSNLDYVFVFHRGLFPAFKIRYGDILNAKDRAIFVAAIKERFADQIDDEMLEPFEIAGEKQSYTELWLKELSASPKRDKLTPLELGANLHNGRYTIISRIGMGGQGTVYLAQDNLAQDNLAQDSLAQKNLAQVNLAQDNLAMKNPKSAELSTRDTAREVVLKEFLLPVFPDTRVRKAAAIKFQEEADLLGKLEHPQIVKFYELFLEDHRAYLVLEKLDGVTLKDYVESKGKLPLAAIEDLARQMCLILQYLHNQTPPVVHRDFTPDNLILSDDGKLKLLDFSVAQSVTSNVTGSVVGKPHYIAPEQFRGKSCSQSDIYSMGATLYFLASGKQPEPITNLKLALEDTSASSNSKPSVNSNASANTKISKVIEKSTKLDLGNRYKRVEEILQDLG